MTEHKSFMSIVTFNKVTRTYNPFHATDDVPLLSRCRPFRAEIVWYLRPVKKVPPPQICQQLKPLFVVLRQ